MHSAFVHEFLDLTWIARLGRRQSSQRTSFTGFVAQPRNIRQQLIENIAIPGLGITITRAPAFLSNRKTHQTSVCFWLNPAIHQWLLWVESDRPQLISRPDTAQVVIDLCLMRSSPDFFNLLKVEGQWTVLSKVYHTHIAP